MTILQICAPTVLTGHALTRLVERGITVDELHQAAADGEVLRRAGDHLEVRGTNGVTYLTDLTGQVVVTVLPRWSRPPLRTRPDARQSEYRRHRRGPKPRSDPRRPRR